MLFVLLTISWLLHGSSYAADYADSTSTNLLLDELTKSCPSDGIPVCGIGQNKEYVIFPNECLLEEVNKNIFLDMTNIKKIPLKHCIYGCHLNCPKISKPICAKNLATHEKKLYYNLCEITKYACKTNTEYIKLNLQECQTGTVLHKSRKLIEKRSKKLKRRPIPCTNTFKPVCASYLGVKSTFKNECFLNAENIQYHRDWRIIKMGICAEDYSNTQQETPTKTHYINKRSYNQNNFEDEYDTNSFKEGDLTNNGVYVFMPTAFQTQYIDHSYQQPMHVVNGFNDIFKKLLSMPSPKEDEEKNMPNHKNLAYGETENKPMPFTTNELNINYISNERSMNDHISASQPTSINNFLNMISNTDYLFTENLNMAFDKPKHETEKNTFESNDLIPELERMTFENNKTELVAEMTTTFSTTKDTTLITTTEIPIITTATPITTTNSPTTTEILITTTEIPTANEIPISQSEVTKKFKLLKEENNLKKIQECQFGKLPICGVLPDGAVKTFDSVCEMMAINMYLKNTWTKLHEGECENCNYNCTKDYQPICVKRNNMNYTMVNDCYFNMGICMDKKSKWKKITNGECERYTRISDKFENTKPGFAYTSSYFVSTEKTTHKPLHQKTRNSNIRKSISIKGRNRHFSASKKSSNALFKKDISVTTYRPTTKMSLYGPNTNSYIMRLAHEKVNQKSIH